MHDALITPVLRALDALPAALPAFIRDDDAGWADDRLFALLDTTTGAGVPIDLAAIPLAIGPALAAALCERVDAAPGLIGLHQHGCEHRNHETTGRSCEFGPGRDAAAQLRDLIRGREQLRAWAGARLQPIFTPPWNRCSADTPRLLQELGFAALSRDRGATPQTALPELPVDLDWSRRWREGGPHGVAQALVTTIAARAHDGRPLGLMLHHAVTGDEELAALRAALPRWAAHPRLQWQPMAALLPSEPDPAPPSPVLSADAQATAVRPAVRIPT